MENNQFDLRGNYIRTWNSFNEASKGTGIQRSKIRRAVLINPSICGGFIWTRSSVSGIFKGNAPDSEMGKVCVICAMSRYTITKKEYNPIAVNKFSIYGEYIETIYDLRIFAKNKSYDNIRIKECCDGDISNFKDCIWRYVGSNLPVRYIREEDRVLKLGAFKPVCQFSKDGKFIKEWYNITTIASELNYSRASIYDVCTGRSKTAYGYIWKYLLIK